MRDEAVAKRDAGLFISTQLTDIPYSSIIGYLNCEQLMTSVIVIADDTDVTKVAFVNEDYGTHSAFLIYYLVNTVNGWKVYNIVSSQS